MASVATSVLRVVLFTYFYVPPPSRTLLLSCHVKVGPDVKRTCVHLVYGLSRLFLQQLLRHYRIIAGSVSAESDLDERFTLRPGLVVFLVLYL